MNSDRKKQCCSLGAEHEKENLAKLNKLVDMGQFGCRTKIVIEQKALDAQKIFL